MSSDDSRSILIQKSMIYEKIDRFKEMAETMKKAILLDDTLLNINERNLFSVAYKNIVGGIRSGWRVLSNLCYGKLNEGKNSENDLEMKIIEGIKDNIVPELNGLCTEVLDLIDIIFTRKNLTTEDKIFYYKMKGDYYRYMAEVNPSNLEEIINNSKMSYQIALNLSSELEDDNPVKLGLLLNYSVFKYEIEGQSVEACEIAKKAFDNACKLQNTAPISDDRTLLLQLLDDNIAIWSDNIKSIF